MRCGTKLLLGNRYRSLKLIGQGRFGRTFLAVDEGEASQPHCVIKQFFPEAQGTDDTEEAAQLFEQEALRIEELAVHPQIPDLLAHFTENQYQYLVQEFIEGQNLQQELEIQGAFNENQIRQLLKDLLPVLQFIHEKNVIHRDIQPKNIIRRTASTSHPLTEGSPTKLGEEGETREGELVIVDFDTAKFVRESILPAIGTVIGTAGYVAPEQALGRGTFASDLYSLAVTCIHLLTQTDPFELYSVSEGGWTWRDYLSNPVTPELGQILDKMLEHGTKRRYKNATEVLNDLTGVNTASEAPAISEITSEAPAIPTTSAAPAIPTTSAAPAIPTTSAAPAIPTTSAAPAIPTTSEAPAIPTTSTPPSPQTSPAVPIVVEARPTPNNHNWQCVRTLNDGRSKGYGGVTSLAWSPNGQFLVSGSEDTTVKVWEFSTGQLIHTLPGNSHFVNSVAISPDGKFIASAADDIIRLWELSTGQEVRTLSGHSGVIGSVTFSPDGQMLASGANDTTIRLWNPNTGEEIRTLSETNLIEVISFSLDGQTLASGDTDKNIKLWNPNTGEEIRTLSGHSRKVCSVSFRPDRQTLASGSSDKTIKIWQLETGKLVHTLTGHTGFFAGVNSVAFSPDGLTLASGSDDKTIKLWSPITGEAITTLSGHSKAVSCVTFSPDGKSLVSGSFDKTIKIWQCN